MNFSDTVRSLFAASLTVACLLVVPATGESSLVIGYDANSAIAAPDPTNTGVGWAWKHAYQADGIFSGNESIGDYDGNFLKFNGQDDRLTIGVVTYNGLSAPDTHDPAGWTLTAVARVVLSDQNSLYASYIRVVANGHEHQLSLINDPVGGHEGVLLRKSGMGDSAPSDYLPFLIAAELDAAYVTFQLVYNPTGGPGGEATTSVYINGALVQTVLSTELATELTGSNIEWGRGIDGSEPSQTHWSEIRFETGYAVIPEPSTYALVGAGLVGAAMLRRRRGKLSSESCSS